MRDRGFSLLEILVVVAVIAIVSGALLLSARGGGSDRIVEAEARRLSRVIELLCDSAVIEGRYTAIGYAARHYAGYRYENDGWRTIRAHGPAEEYRLPEGLGLRELKAGEPLPSALPVKPQILCAPTGDFGPIELVLAPEGANVGWQLQQDATGQLALSAWAASP